MCFRSSRHRTSTVRGVADVSLAERGLAVLSTSRCTALWVGGAFSLLWLAARRRAASARLRDTQRRMVDAQPSRPARQTPRRENLWNSR